MAEHTHLVGSARRLRLAREARARRVHGWAFRDHTDEEVTAIRHFLNTGDGSGLPPGYANFADDRCLVCGEELS